MIRKYSLCCLLCLLFFYFALGQKETNYTLLMQQAMKEGDYSRATNLYTLAQQEDYYDIASLERLYCRILYIQQEYKKAYSLAESLYNEDENDFISEVIRWIYLAGDKEGDSLICSFVEEYDLKNLPNSTLYDLDIISGKDLKKLCVSLSACTGEDSDNEKLAKQNRNTLSTLFYYKQKNYMQAYNKAIDIFSQDNIAIMYFVLGRIKEESKEYTSAIAFYNNAIRNGYNNYEAYLHRALCRGYDADYLSANIDLDTCLMIKEDYYTYFLKGVNYNHLRDYNKALYCLSMSIVLCDTFAEAYNYRGIVYSNVEKYEIALLDFRTCLSLNKKTPYIHDNMGIALEGTGKVAEAMEEYLLSIKYEPNYFDAYYNLGRIHTSYHQNKKALKYLRKALKLETEVSDIYFLIGQNLLEMNKKEQACEYFNTALQMGHTKAEEKLSDIECK